MHLITLFRIMNPHQRCLQAKVKYRNEPKQVMPKSEDPSRSLEINAIWTFDTEFPTIFNKSCTYITFKSAVKHRQLGYGYPRGQTVHLAEATTQYITHVHFFHIYTACGPPPPNINALCMGGGTRCSGRVSVPCFTSDTCHKL